MEGQTRLLWLTCGVLATIGIVAPFAMPYTPDNVPAIQALRAMGGVGFVAGLVAMLRFTGATAPVGDVVYETPPPAPSKLDDNPLSANADRTPLESRIDAAIEASSRYARGVGVIYYNLDTYRQVARLRGVVAAEAAMDKIVANLRTRMSDCERIERLNKGRFVACAVLVTDRQALVEIRDRVNAAMRDMRIGALSGALVEFDEGMAFYPICGDSGASLIAHSRKQCDTTHARRLRAEARRRKDAGRNQRAA